MLVYLHGLNSSGQSLKAARIRDRLAPYPVVAPDYPAHEPTTAIARLSAWFSALGPIRPAVLGSSMGGFYGQWLARRFDFSHLFLINPALTPWDLFAQHIGETMVTARGETYQITLDLVERIRPYGVSNPCDGVPTTVFLDRGDEVIDYRIAESLYRTCGRLRIWDGGDHAFGHLDEAIEILCTRLAIQPLATPS